MPKFHHSPERPSMLTVVDRRGRSAGFAIRCNVIRSRVHRWVARSCYGSLLGVFPRRRDAINVVIDHFGSL
jgi:hypothetical protein